MLKARKTVTANPSDSQAAKKKDYMEDFDKQKVPSKTKQRLEEEKKLFY